MVSQVFTYKYIFVKDKAIILVMFCDYNNVEKRFIQCFSIFTKKLIFTDF